MDEYYELLKLHMELNTKYPIGEYGPPVVHCSAGVGRTGTLICGRFLLEQLRRDPSKIDVVGTVLALRRWRMLTVQTIVQMAFLYLFVLHVIKKENLGPTILTPFEDIVPALFFISQARAFAHRVRLFTPSMMTCSIRKNDATSSHERTRLILKEFSQTQC
ncbi:unnamed protein product [Rodentolepis nana]|uniref:Protein-tyrosine phosphatase n=1 Tax=Rodentolepis nana TaxID=102285 RepID=A0A158QJK1_RODNA|nr:unnamed protein product [Rodentolepis nana]